jgi:hypothetical protein
MQHCVSKILEIVARGEADRRSILQLGYNLGRLSELTGLGREPFWDRWKNAVESWDRPMLDELARRLRDESSQWTSARPAEANPRGIEA